MNVMLTQLLNPDPGVIVKLVDTVVSTPWPEDPSQFDTYFANIGCTPGPLFEHKDDLPESSHGALLMPEVPMENGSWGSLAGKLFNLGFFFYPGTQDSRVLAGPAFEAIRDRITNVYGKATDETEQGQGNQSALWEVDETSVKLYAHVNLAPVLQLGLSHRDLTRLHDKLFIEKRGY